MTGWTLRSARPRHPWQPDAGTGRLHPVVLRSIRHLYRQTMASARRPKEQP